MVTMSTGSGEPNTDRMTKAKISVGIDSRQVDEARQDLIDPAASTAAAKPSDADEERQRGDDAARCRSSSARRR